MENAIKDKESNSAISEFNSDLSNSQLDLKISISEHNLIELKDTEKIVLELQNKIILLEKKNNDLKEKNEQLTKDNIEKSSLMMKMSLVDFRRDFMFQRSVQLQNNSIQLAQIIKEKDDLQLMNEKMLDLLTYKEMENEDLLEKIENYKLAAKLEVEKYLEKIQNLEDKVASLENSNGSKFV